MGLVGSATGLTATLGGQILTTLIGFLGAMGLLAKIDRLIQRRIRLPEREQHEREGVQYRRSILDPERIGASKIFISYRRDDADHAAGRLVERLSRVFSRDQLFLDIDSIAPGEDFKKAISEIVQACDVLLAIIGPGWLSASDEGGERRLDNPKDFVRIEIETALARNIRVIPVLVNGARMPREQDLPETLRALVERQAVRLVHDRFASDADDLITALSRIVAPTNHIKHEANEWRASIVARKETGRLIQTASIAMQIESRTEKHLLELKFTNYSFRDRLILDGVVERFFVFRRNVLRTFRIGAHADLFSVRVQLRPLGTRIKGIQLIRNGNVIFAG